jgi:hypothetical protein
MGINDANSFNEDLNASSLNQESILDPTRRMQQELNLKMKKIRDEQ